MSVEAQAWAYSVTLPPCPKSVLVALANRADEDGYCWPGIEDLEQRTGWKRRAIQAAIKDLQARQLITISPQYKTTGAQTSNLYRLACPEVLATRRRGEGAGRAPLGVQQVRGEGAPHAPKSSSEQSIEQSCEGEAAPIAPACGVTATEPETKTTGKPRGHRASIFPDGWDVEPWMIELCKGFGLNAHAEFAKFRNLHKAKGSLFVSWPHAFKTWVSRSVEFKQRRA